MKPATAPGSFFRTDRCGGSHPFFGKYSRKRWLSHRRRALVERAELVAFLPARRGWTNELPWINIPNVLTIPIGMTVDPLSRTMLVVVEYDRAVGAIYSIGYMAGEEGYWRYFAGLALFLFSMPVSCSRTIS